MGIFGRNRRSATSHTRRVAPAESAFTGMGLGPFLELVGTNSSCRVGCETVLPGPADGSHALATGLAELRAEPDIPADPMAIAVLLGDVRVGYLPGYVARMVQPRIARSPAYVPIQLWAALDGTRARYLAVISTSGDPDPTWPYSTDRQAPVTRAQQADGQAHEAAQRRRQRLAAGGAEATQQRARLVRGRDFTEWAEAIKDMRRDGRDDDALRLLLECIDAAENAMPPNQAPPPWYTDQAAIIYRKRKDYDAEIEVLQRWLRACPDPAWGAKTEARLAKARALRERVAE